MNKKEIIARVARETGNTVVKTGEIVDTLLSTIIDCVDSGNKVKLVGFGVFDKRVSIPRITSHPITKEKIEVPSRRIPTFYPSKIFKNILKK
ncbi:HU family DNA-binding protein [Candidatus Pacearchaeota archaeon]|nr:HU family DNA-binding protein [Candidatus Pacearchaeota archaeon]